MNHENKKTTLDSDEQKWSYPCTLIVSEEKLLELSTLRCFFHFISYSLVLMFRVYQ